ncbi:MAG: hypothetical protein JO110_28605 [Acetobacteraceae bacterium]|nr:hypothetical protein [Acetobacteraceae bacterium]
MPDSRDLMLERVNRLSQAVADLMENQTAQARAIQRMLSQTNERLDAIDMKLRALVQEVHKLASEQALLGNRVEDAFARGLRANVRLDEMEDSRKQ